MKSDKEMISHSSLEYEKVILSLLPKSCKRVLDFGCGEGFFCKQLIKRVDRVYGCDVDKELIKKAKKVIKGVNFKLIKPRHKAHYKKGFFDCVFLMGVLEHVLDERGTLQEIWRILKPSGYLFIYGINKGLFGIFDTGNIKFLFPRIHKFLYVFILGEAKYKKEFVNKKKENMLGDFTLGKRWHTHYSVKDLQELFDGRFEIEEIKHFGLFSPFLSAFQFIYTSFFGRKSGFLEKLIKVDRKIMNSNFSYFFIAKCKKWQ